MEELREKAEAYLDTILDQDGQQCVATEEAIDILVDLILVERGLPPVFKDKKNASF